MEYQLNSNNSKKNQDKKSPKLRHILGTVNKKRVIRSCGCVHVPAPRTYGHQKGRRTGAKLIERRPTSRGSAAPPEPDLETSRGDDPDGEEDAVEHAGRGGLVRDGQPEEDVRHGARHRCPADVVVVPVPVSPHLRRLPRPRQERQHLYIIVQHTHARAVHDA
jgi:hypothetical protein